MLNLSQDLVALGIAARNMEPNRPDYLPKTGCFDAHLIGAGL